MATGTIEQQQAAPDPPPRTRRLARPVLGALAGAAAAMMVVLVLGLGRASALGVDDNGDGKRLFCGLGLTPTTLDGFASWKGGWVPQFGVGVPTCLDPQPSSAAVIAGISTSLSSGTWAPSDLGYLYALLVGVVIGLAAWAASAGGRWRALVVAVPALPLLVPAFPRFFVSTYGEPAGLLGTLAVGCGVAALAVTRAEHRAARVVALLLAAAGGLVAATAKVAYSPVLLAAVVVCALVTVGTGRRRRLVGPAVAVLAVLLAVLPISAALTRQSAEYEAVNTHDIVFTMVLVELGPAATGPLGLPPEAAALTGNGYFNGPPRPDDVGWWRAAILDDPARTRSAAWALLAENPAAVARALGVGLQATLRADLPYLGSRASGGSVLSQRSGDPGWSGARQPDLAQVLQESRHPAWPTALVLVALAAAATARWQGPARRWSLAAGGSAVTALALIAVAVIGDGYFEIFKHVWLPAYLLVVTGLCLVSGAAVTGLAALRRARSSGS
jgi:hypothetical protein